MKKEWILELRLEGESTVQGTLISRLGRYSLRKVDLEAFLRTHGPTLEKLDSLRDPHPMENAPPALDDFRPQAAVLGSALAEAFLSVVATDQIRRLRPAEERLVVLAPAELQRLPWELLRLPDEDIPLAVRPGLELVRRLPGEPSLASPRLAQPPLHIAFTVSDPEGIPSSRRLDHEGELALIAGALRGQYDGHTTALELRPRVFEALSGSTRAIRYCLTRYRTQVLHITGHGQGGKLVLESDEGQARPVDGATLYEEALESARDLVVVLLSQCETARQTADPQALRAATAELSTHLPLVIGMQWSIGFKAATRLAEEFYTHLAEAPEAPVGAFCRARTRLHTWTEQQAGATLGVEWATPVAYLATPLPPRLVDSGVPPFLPVEGAWQVAPEWESILPTGDFIGRRRQLTRLMALLDQALPPMVALTGTAGLGKSALAGRACARLSEQGWHVAVLYGRVTPGKIWGALVEVLEGACVRGKLPAPASTHLRDEIERLSGDRSLELPKRITRLREAMQGRCRLLLVLDDFEQNLEGGPGQPRLRSSTLDTCLGELARPPADPKETSALVVLLTTRWMSDEVPARVHWLPAFGAGEWLWLVDRMERRFQMVLPAEQVETLHARLAGVPRLLELYCAFHGGDTGKLSGQRLRDQVAELQPPSGEQAEDAAQWYAFEVAAHDMMLRELLGAFTGQESGRRAILDSPGVRWLRRATIFDLPVSRDGLLVTALTSSRAVGSWTRRFASDRSKSCRCTRSWATCTPRR